MSLTCRPPISACELRSPIVASAGPDHRTTDGIADLEADGVGAVVLPSLFEEQIIAEERHVDATLEPAPGGSARRSTTSRRLPDYDVGPDRYLTRVEQAKAAVDDAGDRQPQRHLGRRLGALRRRSSRTPAPMRSS